MTVTVVSFRENFPEFTDTTAYPASGVTYWLNYAVLMYNPAVWSTLLDLAIELFIAHNIVLERQAQKIATNGGAPGLNSGPLSSKGVDKVSAGYDTGASTLEGWGNFNLTTYGTRLVGLMQMAGQGGMQT